VDVTQGPPLEPSRIDPVAAARSNLWSAVWEASQFCDYDEIRRIVERSIAEIVADEP
jgi:hypothetical protein